MLQDTNLLERHVFRHYWDDGQLDLFAAAGVLLIGIFWLSDQPAGAAIVPALMVPIWQPLRRRFVVPRMGLVEFNAARERRNQQSLKLMMYGGIAVLIIGIEVYFFRDALPDLPSVSLVASLPAFILAFLAIVTSFLIGSARFVLYAGILAAAATIGALLGWRPGAILTAAGAGMLAIACTIVARFVMANPVGAGDDA